MLQERLDEIDEEIDDLQNEIDSMQGEIDEAQDEIAELDNMVTSLYQDQGSLEDNIEEFRREQRNIEDELNNLD